MNITLKSLNYEELSLHVRNDPHKSGVVKKKTALQVTASFTLSDCDCKSGVQIELFMSVELFTPSDARHQRNFRVHFLNHSA